MAAWLGARKQAVSLPYHLPLSFSPIFVSSLRAHAQVHVVVYRPPSTSPLPSAYGAAMVVHKRDQYKNWMKGKDFTHQTKI